MHVVAREGGWQRDGNTGDKCAAAVTTEGQGKHVAHVTQHMGLRSTTATCGTNKRCVALQQHGLCRTSSGSLPVHCCNSSCLVLCPMLCCALCFERCAVPCCAVSCVMQDATAELRARRQKAMSAAQSAHIRKGMIRYVQLVGAF